MDTIDLPNFKRAYYKNVSVNDSSPLGQVGARTFLRPLVDTERRVEVPHYYLLRNTDNKKGLDVSVEPLCLVCDSCYMQDSGASVFSGLRSENTIGSCPPAVILDQ